MHSISLVIIRQDYKLPEVFRGKDNLHDGKWNDKKARKIMKITLHEKQSLPFRRGDQIRRKLRIWSN